MKPILSHHTKVSRQQINSAVGILFAFLVKALLAVTVSDVFSQLAWNTVTTRTTEIGVDDDLFSILTNGFYILDLPLWHHHHPLAIGLALVFWLLPAASVIASATLNVDLAPITNSGILHVPRVDFTSLNFPWMTVFPDDDSYTIYISPLDAVKKVVTATTAEGKILPIQAPSTNSSWTLNFHDPALSCEVVDEGLQNDIMQNIRDAVNQLISHTIAKTSYGYNSWAYLAQKVTAICPSTRIMQPMQPTPNVQARLAP